MAIYFEWDPAKARINLRDHGIAFELASAAFDDEDRLITEDSVVEGEQRWRTTGLVNGQTVLLVIHLEGTWGADLYVRIISARKATRAERHEYEQNRTKSGG